MSLPADRYGLPLSTTSADAARHYVDGLDRLLSYDGGAEERLAQAMAADANFALPHAGLAVLRWQQGKEAEAMPLAERAEALAKAATPREQHQVAIILTTLRGGGYLDSAGYQAPNSDALRLCREHLAQFPNDALVLLIVTILGLFSGRPWERDALLALYESLAPAYGADWWFLSWFGTCQEECGSIERASELIDQALTLNPRNPIAAHGHAHVLYETGHYERSAAFLRDWLHDYDPSAVYHSHITWHHALTELLLGRTATALKICSRAIDPAVIEPVRTTLADAVGFLWRCHLYAPEAGPLPWASVRDYAAREVVRPGVPFRDVLAATAYAGAGDDAALDRMLDDLAHLDAKGHPLAAPVVLPLVEGIRSFALGDYDGAIRWLESVVDEAYRIGGSNQQRDIFEETLLEAYVRAELYTRAAARLNARAEHPPSAHTFWLGHKRARAGLRERPNR